MNLFDPSNGTARQIIPSLKESNIWNMTQDDSGNIWIAAHDEGLGVYRPNDGSFQLFRKHVTVSSDGFNQLPPPKLQTNNIVKVFVDSR